MVIFTFILPAILIIGLVALAMTARRHNLKTVIAAMGGQTNGQGDGTFICDGRPVMVRYIHGSKNRHPELRIWTEASFGNNLLIRYETAADRFFKIIGLNREPQIADRDVNDRLYFECDDQQFVDRLFCSTEAKTVVFDLLKNYTNIDICRNRCLLRKYPAPSLAQIDQLFLQCTARELLQFCSHIPAVSTERPEVTLFQIHRILLTVLGTLTLGAGFIALVWASSHFRVVEGGRLWQDSLHITLPVFLLGSVLGFIIIRGYATSAKVLIGFIICLGIGGILVGRYGTAIYNGISDRSPVIHHNVSVLERYSTRSKNSTSYHARVKNWHPDKPAWSFRITYSAYQQLIPGQSCYKIISRRGSLGYEWIIAEILMPRPCCELPGETPADLDRQPEGNVY